MDDSLSILIDADALVALAKRDDSNHDRALRESKWLDERGASLYISPFTIPEAVTVLSYKVSQKTAIQFLQNVRDKNFLTCGFDNKLQKKADGVFTDQNQKGTSYFDCVNMALMNEFNLDAIFSFDKAYTKNNFLLTDDLID